jgi:PPOX class probable F420-dependent enzyme
VNLRQSLASASYRMYDRLRHESAFDTAATAGTAADFAAMRGHKYALLVTFRRDGTPVPTPVWFALVDDQRLVVHTEERTGKVRRLRRDPRARVFPCDPRGRPCGPGVDGTARVLSDPAECERADAALDRRYGRTRRVYDKLLTDASGMVYVEVAASDTAISPAAKTT